MIIVRYNAVVTSGDKLSVMVVDLDSDILGVYLNIVKGQTVIIRSNIIRRRYICLADHDFFIGFVLTFSHGRSAVSRLQNVMGFKIKGCVAVLRGNCHFRN